MNKEELLKHLFLDLDTKDTDYVHFISRYRWNKDRQAYEQMEIR